MSSALASGVELFTKPEEVHVQTGRCEGAAKGVSDGKQQRRRESRERMGILPRALLQQGETAAPTQKPEVLFERMILASSNLGDTVSDPFVRSGASLRVCQQLGRYGIRIDVNPEYAEMTRERLEILFTGFYSIDKRTLRVSDGLNGWFWRNT